MRIGFTGTRCGMSAAQKQQLRVVFRAFISASDFARVFHHGAAVGADSEAAEMATQAGLNVIAHPANGRPLERNKEIVDACDVLVAAPLWDTEQQRSGTWATIRYARKRGKPVVMLSRVPSPLVHARRVLEGR